MKKIIPVLFLVTLFSISFVKAMDIMQNPYWYIFIWDSGYSDCEISPKGHEQLSGEWAAAIYYNGIPNGEAMWLEPNWVCPDWVSNSQFSVVQPFTSWDDPANPINGYNDTGRGVITNGTVEITIDCVMLDAYTVMGLYPGVETPNRVSSYRYVMLETYKIKNVTANDISNLSFFQMLHAHPNDDYGPNIYGVYDPTDYSDASDSLPEYHFDMTFYSPYENWSLYLDDVIGFSSTIQPTTYQIGEFPSPYCSGGEPGIGSLHHIVEADNLNGVNYFGPEETAGAMEWYLGALKPDQEVSLTVLMSTSHSDMGLPPEPVPTPTTIQYMGDTEGNAGAEVTLCAELKDQFNNPLLGKIIHFLLGTQAITAITNAAGVACTPLVLAQPAGNYMVTASFLGDSEYGGSLDSDPFNILEGIELKGKVQVLPAVWYTTWGTPHTGRIRCWIGELAGGYDVTQINRSTLLLNGTVPMYGTTYRIISSWPGFTGSVLEVAFDRYSSYMSLGSVIPGNQYPVTITGDFNDGVGFSGETMITVQTAAPKLIGEAEIPESFSLIQNYPNPFNPETDISYALPSDCQVKLTIYNLLGQKVKTLVNEPQTAGYKTVHWGGKDEQGNLVASGIYFYKLNAGDYTSTKKMVMTK
jgi:hypothetical protein